MGSRLEKNSTHVRKRIESHNFEDEQGEEYEGSKFGGFSDYMRRKKMKLQNLDVEIRSQSTDKPPIFRNIVAHVNGYTQPSLSDLHKLIVSHGGGFLQYLDGKTAATHVIASNLTPKKRVEFARYRIVKPAWIVDSVKAGKLLPWDAYRLVDEGVSQKVLGFENGQVVSQANNQILSYRDHSETGWYSNQFRQQAQNLGQEGAASNQEPEVVERSHEQPPWENVQSGPANSLTTNADDVAWEDFEDVDFDDMNEDAELIRSAHNPPATEEPPPNLGPAEMTHDDEPSLAAVLYAGEGGQASEVRQLSAEEHNARLLSNPHMAKSSTANPDFINQYYRESRLHHLSTWKADLKAQLQARTQEKSFSQKQRQKTASGSRRYIMHVDFDSFFAAVSLRKNPHLKDKPVVIAHGSGPGSEIASCNYPARKYGVKNGMWMKTALGLCPDLKVLPYDFILYEEASRHFYDSMLAIDGIVQSISIDEALIDVSDHCIKAGGSSGKGISEVSIYREQEKAEQLAQTLRDSIKEKTGCDVSVGIGNNILLAKVALRKAKPAGQYLVKPEEVLEFLADLLVTDLPGVAWSIGKKLEEIGVKHVKDIRSLTKERLVKTLGPKTGEKIWDYSRGIDKQEVGEQATRKSVSAEINWGIRFINQQQAEDFVQCLCDELSKRLLEQLVKGKQLTMKIMRKSADAGMDPPKSLGHGKCDTFNKSVILGVATTDKAIIGKEAISILRSYGFSPGELRGLGVQMQKLEPLKPAPSTISSMFDSSQRRLQFKNPTATTATSSSIQITTEGRATSPPATEKFSIPSNEEDLTEEIPTPRKDKRYSNIVGALEQYNEGIDASRQRPLNISGTQFILPSQIDPTVLAELPADIRSKLAPKQKSIIDAIAGPASPLTEDESHPASPYQSDNELGLPNQSQLDPEALEALPEDLRQELLAHYHATENAGPNRRAQQLLPQSPRQARPVLGSKKPALTPTKKQKTSSLLLKGRSKTNVSSVSNLMQSNFVSTPKSSAKACDSPGADEEISQSFLDELPEDIRFEILAEQKRNRLKSKSGLDLGTAIRKPRKAISGADPDAVGGQQKLQLHAQSTKPTFTSRKLSSLPELRNAMTAWVDEFSADGEGPFSEDVEALAQYLERVVADERDMAKAAAIINWLTHIVANQDFGTEQLRTAWEGTLRQLEDSVQNSVLHRGLAPVEFG